MGDPNIRNKKPRKILGNGCATEFLKTNSSNNNRSRNLSNNQAQHPAAHILLNNNSNGTNISALATPLTLQQQQQFQQQFQHHYHQQMERLRIAGIINQEIHPLWPYGPFIPPILPAPNMPLPYAITGTLPFPPMPIFHAGPQQCTVPPVSSNPNASPTTNHQSQPQQQQQQQSINIRSNIPNNVSNNSNPNTNNLSTNSTNNNYTSTNQSNEPNKINAQKGSHCATQNTPVEFNSTNDTTTKLNLLNFCGPNKAMPSSADKDNRESSSSLGDSPTISELNDSNNATNNNGAGDDSSKESSPNVFTSGTNNINGNDTTVTLSEIKLHDLSRLALRGSEIAERVAFAHRNRPCFKKIDSLCARMKQDLIRPDGVLPNINSQGIAWAVKDFIFVFTRVINAWIIIKGYVYNTPDGLNKVKAALSPDFQASFAAWQDTTLDFIESLIKSFVNLDNLVQSQKSAFQKTENSQVIQNTNMTPIKILQSGNSLFDDAAFDFLNNSTDVKQQDPISKNYMYTMVEDSEGSQRQATVNGTYFKTGTYNPIKKETFLTPKQLNDICTSDNNNTNNIETTNNNSNITNDNNNNNSNNAPSTATTFTVTQATPATPPPIVVSARTSSGHLLANNSPLAQCFDDAFSEFWPTAEIYSTTKTPSAAAEVAAVATTTSTTTTTTKTTMMTMTTTVTAPAGGTVTAIETLKIVPKTTGPPPSSITTNWSRYDLTMLEKSFLNNAATTTITSATATTTTVTVTAAITTPTTTTATTSISTTTTSTISDNGGGGDSLITFDDNTSNKNETTTIATPTGTMDTTLTSSNTLGKDLIDKFNIMIERLMSMKNADLFFKLQFTKNYFPDFIAKHKTDFMDVRSIILKCQIGGYRNIHEVVHDIRKIVFAGKEFLKINNDAKLHKCLIAFEAELNKLLSEPPFDNYHFEHITGETKELL